MPFVGMILPQLVVLHIAVDQETTRNLCKNRNTDDDNNNEKFLVQEEELVCVGVIVQQRIQTSIIHYEVDDTSGSR